MKPNSFLPARLIALALTLGAAVACVGTHATEPIDCETTPFGATNLMLGDAEFMSLLSNNDRSFKPIGEYRLPRAGESDPLNEVYSGNLIPAGLPADVYFLDAANVDLNGDGRDEIAVAYGIRSDPNQPIVLSKIIIGIFQRTPGFAPSARMIDSWQLDGNLEGTGMTTSSVELEAGDFRGTSTRVQQLALMWRGSIGPTDGKMNVIVLTGAPDGSLIEADNSWAGRWGSTAGFGKSSLTHGDVLLDGRDQLMVVAIDGHYLHIHLLEFNPPNAHANSGLPIAIGDMNIGSRDFVSDIFTFADDGFEAPSLPPSQCTPFGSPFSCSETVFVNTPHRLLANAGNLVDTAAAELLVHLSFSGQSTLRDSNGTLVSGRSGYYIGQRLLHFSKVQVAPGADISAVTISSSGPGRDFDTSQIIGPRNQFEGLPSGEVTQTAFDAAVGRVFGGEQNQLALVRVADSPHSRQLQVDLYSAGVRLQAGFKFDVIAGTGPFTVKFTSTATGDVDSRHWDFGDGSASVAENPSHNYNATGSYTVTLTVTDRTGKTSIYGSDIVINGQASSGGQAESYTYQMDRSPLFSTATQDTVYSPSPGNFAIIENNFYEGSQPRIAIGDMDRDGSTEILTTAQSIVREGPQFGNLGSAYRATIWRSLWRLDSAQIPAAITQAHAQQVTGSGIFPSFPPAPYAASTLLASDFDGDSVFATLGTQCGAVYEPQLRNLIWMPPFFSALQSGSLGNGYMSASFGNQQTSGSSVENRSGSFTSHSISAYVGVSAGTTDNEPVNFRSTLKATAGHDWQTSKGAIHGEENEQTYSEGQAATQGDALVVSEGNSALCYSYNVVQSSGPVPNSAMRMCQMTDHERTAQTAESWNAQFIYGQTEPNWAPLQRDWASRALFVPPTSSIPFQSGRGLDKATDGLFSTAATSVSTTQPYLDIDLGSVQPIEAIRIFPAANVDDNGAVLKPIAFNLAALDLQGFRVYVSATPFNGPEVPGGAGVRVFAPPTDNGMVYDRWNIFARDANFNPLPARYIRLQHPDQSQA
ncbi:PKD domain-containing protein, partial [Dokdonella sp.]|uniref:PKD domain-containing protein n=1 Tax=Dokdonella sp. TaxID=2291710 RepID=UPI003C508A31